MAKKHKYRSRRPDYKEVVHTQHCAMKRRKLAQLSEAQGYRCCYCSGETFLLEPGDALPKGMSWNQRATLEHLIPQCKPVQTNKDENLVMACSICNGLRGERDPIGFYKSLRSVKMDSQRTQKSKPISAEKFLKLRAKEGRALALCLIVFAMFPREAAYWAEHWKPRVKKARAWARRRNKINKIVRRMIADPRRLAA